MMVLSLVEDSRAKRANTRPGRNPKTNTLQPGRFNTRTSCGISRSKARPRWLRRRFTAGLSSPNVR